MNLEVEEPEPWTYTISAGEWVFIGIGIFVHTISCIVAAYVFKNRAYPPLKIKQIPLVLISVFSGMIWWVGGLASTRMLPETDNPVLTKCDLWSVWIQQLFGLTLWFDCVLFRFWTLFWVVKLKKPANNWRFHLTFFIFIGPVVIYAIVSSILKTNGPILTPEGHLVCLFEPVALYVYFILLGLSFLFMVYLMIRLRNIKLKYLQEYRQNIQCTFIFLVAYIVYIIIVVLREHNHLWGRAICTMIVITVTTSTFYITIGAPAYHCFFHREEYAERFKEKRKMISLEQRKKSDGPTASSLSLSNTNNSVHE